MPPTAPRLVPVPGSDRRPVAGARRLQAVAPDERVEVTVVVRPRTDRGPAAADGARAAALPGERQFLTRAQLAETRGASPEDLASVEDFAADHGLDVVSADAGRRSVVLAGSAGALAVAFAVDLARYQHDGGTYRGRTGPVQVPADLAGVIEGVFGLDDRPAARPHFRCRPPAAEVAARAVNGSFTPVELARLYDFPTGIDGTGQTIAIIELGGGYRRHDLKAYFDSLGVACPRVSAVSVDGGRNLPEGNPNGADGEVMLDVEVAGAVAPGARIVVYFAPNTDRGFLDAVTTAVHDDRRRPSIVSISWGQSEDAWTEQSLKAFDDAFAAAAALGVTVCCASGDDGSSDRAGDERSHCDFPASSPHVLACGGTRLEARAGHITSEVVWHEASGGASGGGVSDRFARPAWQASANVPRSTSAPAFAGRGVPDVAAVADPATGYKVRVDGQDMVIGGTSAVAPLWAGLLALVNQHLGQPVGFLNPVLYGPLMGSGALHDITMGTNGAYHARPGWDPCTGLGSPDGAALLAELSGR